MNIIEKHTASNRRHRLTLASCGAWRHLIVAAMLITVVPAMVSLWLCINSISKGDGDTSALVAAGIVGVLFASLGYALLVKYPVSIVRLRSYLHGLAHDQLPGHVTLPQNEDDISAIHEYLEKVVGIAADRLRLQEEKHAADLVAERHRIMVESIGALCHHVGQPVSLLGMQLHLMRSASLDPETDRMLIECEKAFEEIKNTLDRLRHLTYYETEGYLSSQWDDRQILRVPDPLKRTPGPGPPPSDLGPPPSDLPGPAMPWRDRKDAVKNEPPAPR